MKDPWEPEESVQQLQPELIQEMTTPDSVSNVSKQPGVSSNPLQQKPGGDEENSRQVKKTPTTVDQNGFSGPLQLNRENMLRGVIWAEILGKPLAKRGRRR